MGVKIRKKGNYLYLDIMYKGKRRWESIGLTVPKDAASRRETMAQAEAIRHKRELQLASERYQLLDPVASKETIIEYAEKIAATYDKKAHLPKMFYVNWISLELSSEFPYRYQQEFPGFIISLHNRRFSYAPPSSRRGPVSTVVFGFSLPGPGCRMRACVIL